MPEPPLTPAEAALDLRPDEVHVWRASLAQPPNVVERLSHLLTDDERHRAAGYVIDVHRSRFVASRGIQRDVLSRYVGIPAGDLEFVYSSTGKPAFGGAAARSGVTFNVSNSAELAVYAVARGRAIGVDVEELRPLGDALTIADRFLPADDLASIDAAPEAERAFVFFQCWTRFEARVKALGLSVGDRFGDAARSLTSCALDLGPAYLGALVIDDQSSRIRYFDWTA